MSDSLCKDLSLNLRNYVKAKLPYLEEAVKLRIMEKNFSVCKLPSADNVEWQREFVFFARTDDEISLVCETEHVPPHALRVERGWKAMRICGVLDFGETGIIARLSSILAANGISVFVVSTYDTDYVLVRSAVLEKTVRCLEENGYVFEREAPEGRF